MDYDAPTPLYRACIELCNATRLQKMIFFCDNGEDVSFPLHLGKQSQNSNKDLNELIGKKGVLIRYFQYMLQLKIKQLPTRILKTQLLGFIGCPN